MHAVAGSQSGDLKRRLALISLGTMIEIELPNQQRAAGTLKEVTDRYLVLQVAGTDQPTTVAYPLEDIKGVRTILKGGVDLEVSSESLGAVVLDENIKLTTRDGTYVEGKVLGAGTEEITIDVKKSEPKGRMGTGHQVIRTSDIVLVRMKKNGSVAAPVALGVVCGLLGAVASGYSAWYAGMSEGELIAFELAGMAGGAVAGAYAGHATAMKTVTIGVVDRR
jgi:ribosome maturation factor RimP